MRAVIDGAPTGGRGQGRSACHPSRGCHHTRRKRPWGRSLGDTKSTAPRPHDGKTLTAFGRCPFSSARIQDAEAVDRTSFLRHTSRRYESYRYDTTRELQSSSSWYSPTEGCCDSGAKGEQGDAGEDHQRPARHATKGSRRHGLQAASPQDPPRSRGL